uniref:Uncharacterized protein n=1 Tax=Kalanchoe fedtschenkoi TaxID=63787 RepID=A0A7N0TQD2_KALFE
MYDRENESALQYEYDRGGGQRESDSHRTSIVEEENEDLPKDKQHDYDVNGMPYMPFESESHVVLLSRGGANAIFSCTYPLLGTESFSGLPHPIIFQTCINITASNFN